MKDYLSASCCCGVQPRDVITSVNHSRPRLVAALLEKRQCARFILAPPKYGKKYIAVEYAHVVFDFNDTYWIDCTSPYFMRDLDNDSLIDQIAENSLDMKLIVFADVPRLDGSRRKNFFTMLRELLRLSIEVIVTSYPELGDSIPHFLESQVLNPCDLTLTEVELRNTNHNDISTDCNGNFELPVVAPRAWRGGFKNIHLEEHVAKHDRDTALVKLLMYIFAECEIDDLVDVSGLSCVESICYSIERYEPHIFVDLKKRTICTERVSIEDIELVFRDFIRKDLNKTIDVDEKHFFKNVADMLFSRGDTRRGLSVIDTFLKQNEKVRWASKECEAILKSGSCAGTLAMLRDVSVRNVGDVASKMYLEFLFFLFTCQYDRCSDLGVRIANAASMPLNIVFITLSLLTIYSDKEKSFRAVSKLSSLHQNINNLPKKLSDLDDFFTEKRILQLAELIEISYDDLYKGLIYLATLVENSCKEQKPIDEDSTYLHFLIASYFEFFLRSLDTSIDKKWAIRKILSKERHTENACTLIKHLIEFVFDSSVALSKGGKMTIHNILACKASQSLLTYLAKRYQIDIPKILLEEVDEYCLVQSQDIKQATLFVREDKSNTISTSIASKNSQIRRGATRLSRETFAPTLSINVFGPVAFSVGGINIASEFVKRKKLLLLLGLLVLNKGRELSRDEIMSVLWDETCVNKKSNSNNLYTMVSTINRFFERTIGSKYIIKGKCGYFLDTVCVKTDYDAFVDICKSLYYLEFTAIEWKEIIETLRGEFAEPFLKQLPDNDFVNIKRAEISLRLIDSLVAAGQKLLVEGEYRGCLEFAKEALTYDVAREDAYHLLMSSQSKLEQRSAAIQTYFRCKKNLNSALGLDPSNSIKDIYRQVLDM